MSQTATLSKTLAKPIAILKVAFAAFAEAHRDKATAEAVLKKERTDVLAYLTKGSQVHEYADGKRAEFRVIESSQAKPVDVQTAQKLLGWGDTRMLKATKLDPEYLKGLVKAKQITQEQYDELVPSEPMVQIRAFDAK